MSEPACEKVDEAKTSPPGTYLCPECMSTAIVWRSKVDEYKTKCPKCGCAMELSGPPADSVVDVVTKLHRTDPEAAKIYCAARGVDLKGVLFYASIRRGLSGWELGVTHGTEEATGKRPAPGAVKLAWLKWKYGTGYILGRQHALASAGMHGGTKSKSSLAEAALKLLEKQGNFGG